MARHVEIDIDSNADTGGFLATAAAADRAADRVDALGDQARGTNREMSALDRQLLMTKAAMTALGDSVQHMSSRDLTQVRQNLDGFNASLRRTAGDTHTLDDRIAASQKGILALGEEYRRTGDKDVFKNLREERGTLRNLQQMSKEMDTFGNAAKSAGRNVGDLGNFSGVISAGLSALPAEAKAALAGAVAAMLPALGAAVNSVVLLAVGGGSLAAGIVGAFQTARVSEAFHGAFGHIFDGFVSASGPLVEPLSRAAFMFSDAFDKLMPSIEKGMQHLAPVVTQLAAGLVGFIDRIGPGFAKAFEAAIPVLNEFADTLPVLGQGMSDFFSSIAVGGPGAAAFWHDFIHLLALTLAGLGNAIGALSILYSGMSAIGKLMIGDATGALTLWRQFGPMLGMLQVAALAARGDLGGAGAALAEMRQKGDETGGSVEALKRKMADASAEQAFSQGMQVAAQQMQAARQAAEDFEHQLSNLATQILNGKNADLAFKQGRLDMIDALKASKGSLDENTASGIKAEQSMLRQAQNAVAVRDSMLQQKLGVDAADAAYDGLIAQIYADAAANHVSKEAVDGVIGSLRNIPRPNPVDIVLRRMGYSDDDLREYKRSLLGATGTYTATVNTVRNTYFNTITSSYSEALPGPYARGNAKGGIVHADSGVISKPGIYRGRGNGMVVAAEGVTGYEGFVPQLGISRGRAATLLSEMAGWHGYGVYDQQASGYREPAGPSTVGGGGANLALSVGGGGSAFDQAFAEWIMYAIRIGLIALKTDSGDRVGVS